MPRLYLDLVVNAAGYVPKRAQFAGWARSAIRDCPRSVRLGVRVVEAREAASLNEGFRGRPGPTNVLSFGYEDEDRGAVRFLGDLVLCAPVVAAEARDLARPLDAHWAHLVIHGILHLRGFDHETDQDARLMETRETQLLERLGFADPYR